MGTWKVMSNLPTYLPTGSQHLEHFLHVAADWLVMGTHGVCLVVILSLRIQLGFHGLLVSPLGDDCPMRCPMGKVVLFLIKISGKVSIA